MRLVLSIMVLVGAYCTEEIVTGCLRIRLYAQCFWFICPVSRRHAVPIALFCAPWPGVVVGATGDYYTDPIGRPAAQAYESGK